METKNAETCPKLKPEICKRLGKKVDPNFCNTFCCKGENLDEWKARIKGFEPEPIKQEQKPNDENVNKIIGWDQYNRVAQLICEKCDDKYCVIRKMPCRAGRPGYECPKNKFFRQPAKHPARYRKVFCRTDGRIVDIVDLFHGQSCFFVCNGPSVTNYEKHIISQPGIVTMGINNGPATADFRPTLWTAQDPPYRFMRGIWEDAKIMKFTLWDYRNNKMFDPVSQEFIEKRYHHLPNLFFHRRHSAFHANKWFGESKIVWGCPKKGGGNRSTMLAALHILWFLGFHKVYLLGADFKMDKNTKYFFEQDRGPAAIRSNNQLFANMKKYFANLLPFMVERGFLVYNCNPKSNLKVFPYMPLEEAVKDNLINTSISTKDMYVKRITMGKKGRK